jgi:hypothetical protein
MESQTAGTGQGDQTAPQSPSPRRPWVAPTLTSHASLTALTQAQYRQGFDVDSINGGPQQAVPCSQGFCP